MQKSIIVENLEEEKKFQNINENLEDDINVLDETQTDKAHVFYNDFEKRSSSN